MGPLPAQGALGSFARVGCSPLQRPQPHLTAPLGALGSSADHPSVAAQTTAPNSATSAGPSATSSQSSAEVAQGLLPGRHGLDAGAGRPTSMMLPRSPDPASKNLTSICRGLPRDGPHTGLRMRGDGSSAGPCLLRPHPCERGQVSGRPSHTYGRCICEQLHGRHSAVRGYLRALAWAREQCAWPGAEGSLASMSQSQGKRPRGQGRGGPGPGTERTTGTRVQRPTDSVVPGKPGRWAALRPRRGGPFCAAWLT